MSFIPLESSMILGIRYDERLRDLDIVYRTGEKYRYKNVPRSVYDELMSAESHGQFMHQKILGRYEFRRLD